MRELDFALNVPSVRSAATRVAIALLVAAWGAGCTGEAADDAQATDQARAGESIVREVEDARNDLDARRGKVRASIGDLRKRLREVQADARSARGARAKRLKKVRVTVRARLNSLEGLEARLERILGDLDERLEQLRE